MCACMSSRAAFEQISCIFVCSPFFVCIAYLFELLAVQCSPGLEEDAGVCAEAISFFFLLDHGCNDVEFWRACQ